MKCKKCNANIGYGAQFCRKCGASVIDYEVKNSTMQLSRAELKKAKITIAVAVCLLVLIIVAMAVVPVMLLKDGGIGSANKSTVRKAYSSYLNNTIVEDIGIAQTDTSKNDMTGVYSAKPVNLDKKKSDEFIVAYAKKKGKKTEVSIDCYEYDNDSSEDKDVNLVGSVNPDADGINVFADDFISPKSSALSIVKNDGKTYIVYESIQYDEVEYYYGCQFYLYEDGEFSECSSVFAELNEAYEVVYSENLPETMDINSSDVNLDDYNIDSVPEGADVLYALGGLETEVKFDEYYDSVNSAVCDYLKQFGIDEEEFWVYENKDKSIRTIAENESKERLFEYIRYIDYDDNEEIHCELKDYTDVNSFIEEADSDDNKSDEETEEETKKVDKKTAIKLTNQLKLKDYQYPMYYGLGKFNVDELSNDMILSMGYEMKEFYETPREGPIKQYCTKTQLEKQIKSIVGPDIEYTVKDFNLYDKKSEYVDFIGYSHNIFPDVKLKGSKLVSRSMDGGGGDIPFIAQIYDYSEQTGDTINIYFKSAFVNTEFDEGKEDFIYSFYTDYKDTNKDESEFGYSYGEFSGYLNEMPAMEFPYGEDYNFFVFNKGQKFDSFWDDMNTAVYSFEKSSDGKYYFSGFEFIKK